MTVALPPPFSEVAGHVPAITVFPQTVKPCSLFAGATVPIAVVALVNKNPVRASSNTVTVPVRGGPLLAVVGTNTAIAPVH
ncbi:hypothetical protein G3V73_24085 [Escherichia coli]|nr:hypothetical protein [Escherichia coli]